MLSTYHTVLCNGLKKLWISHCNTNVHPYGITEHSHLTDPETGKEDEKIWATLAPPYWRFAPIIVALLYHITSYLNQSQSS
jgi:hypothetical protein